VSVRHVTESDVRSAVAPGAAVALVRDALRSSSPEPASIAIVEGVHVRAQVARDADVVAALAQGSARAGDGAVLAVFGPDGRTVAVIEADWLTRMAAAAAAAVAAAHLAPRGSQRVGIVGDGPLADAVEQCLPEALEVTALRRGDLPDAHALVRDATVIVTATRARDPVLRDDWLGDGICVLALGATRPDQRELDYRTIVRAATVITDAPDEARQRAADLSETVATGHLDWLEVHGLDELERGELQPLRRPDDVTVYKGVGTARLALAVAAPLLGRR
jgi:ornithine cyclodeaminase/alanine dehydrogenase-like protein (mu-crystallin family)